MESYNRKPTVMSKDTSVTPWRLAWQIKGMALRAALVPFCLMAVLYVGIGAIEAILRPVFGAAWLAVYEALYTGLDALLIGTLLEALLSDRPPGLPSRRAAGFALAFVPLGAVLSVPHFFLRLALGGDFAKGGPPATPWEMLLLQHPMQWLVLGLFVALLARRLLRLPPRPPTGPGSDGLPAMDRFVAMVLIGAVLASGLAMGVQTILSPRITLWGAFPGPTTNTIVGHAGALVSWYAATYIVTVLVAAGAAVLLSRPARAAIER